METKIAPGRKARYAPETEPRYKNQYLVCFENGAESTTPDLCLVRLVCQMKNQVRAIAIYQAKPGPFGNGLKFYEQKTLEASMIKKG